MKKLPVALSLIAALSLSACEVRTSGQFGDQHFGNYVPGAPNGYAQNAYVPPNGSKVTIEYGTLLALQEIRPQAENNAAKTVGGALLGGAVGAGLGNAIMHGKARKNGMIIGGALGALAGGAGAQTPPQPTIINYTVNKEDGTTVVISQAIAEGEAAIRPGQRVMIQTAGNDLHVFPAPELPGKGGRKMIKYGQQHTETY